MRTYIVEDSKIVLDRLVSLLEEVDGLKIVGQTGSLKTATENILLLQPDVILVDIRLSDGNGLDVLAKIRRWGLKTTSMVMTLDPYPEHRKLAMEWGAAYFFDKTRELCKIPIAFEQLIAAQQAPEKRHASCFFCHYAPLAK